MHSSKLNKMTAALCMALLPISVFAAGLGKLNVNSGLGEPLRADIELLSVTTEELNSIVATIASEEAYANQGIERPASHNNIKIEIVKNSAGTPILKLKSTQPISEPFLDMLIQVDWSSGRLLREYTVLLDPPGYIGEAAADSQSNAAPTGQSTQAPVVARSESSTATTGTATENRNTQRINPIAPSKKIESKVASEAAGQDYLTQRGDSLARIARDMKPEGISLDQMLIGLYQANPDAFDGKNINRLKVGKIIRQPSEQELASISRQDASKEVKVQSANWNAYRNKLAGIVAESVLNDSETNTQSAGGKIKSAAEDQSLPARTGPKDVVKLSAGEAKLTKKEAEEVNALQAKITALQEESTAREKSVKEAQEKTAALEKQVEDMQKLLALKNGTMADLQKQAEIQAQQSNEAEQIKPVEAENPAPAETAPADTTNSETPAAAPTSDNKQIETKAAPTTVIPEPIAEPSILDELDMPLLGGGLGLLALLTGIWVFLRNKRKRNLADFEQGIMTSGGLKANTVFGNTSGSSVDTGDTSFLTDFSQSANGGMIDTNDVDPIAEAEVYMAYGRDAQAEEILKDAISKEPKRYELHLKLLEMYAASKNVSAFETIAGELYTSLGSADPTWAKVAEIGQKLEPSNPLYQESTVHSATGEKLDANDFSDSPIASETDLDFSFDEEAVGKDLASNTSKKDAFDLDLDSLNMVSDNTDNQQSTSSDDLENINAVNTADSLDSVDSNRDALNPFLDTVVPGQESLTTSEVLVKESHDDAGLDFNFGELTSKPDESASSESFKTDAASFGHTMPGLDMSGFDAPKSEPTLDELPSFNLNETDFDQQDTLNEAAELPNENLSADTDFNFDLTTISPEASSYVEEDAAANTFDLSGISLDMDNATANDAPISSTADEPIEIETKLDLVAAYLDMDDKEGAKELLDEVVKEGGAGQRKRAEEILAKLS
ncbi:MAG: FimV/HubP family polar landmark protein [Pseudomonadota bacterium]